MNESRSPARRSEADQRAPFDHLIGATKQRQRESEAERLGGLQVDDELNLRGLLDGKIGGFFTFEYPAGIDSYSPVRVMNSISPLLYKTLRP
jgi:hypothetical protein